MAGMCAPRKCIIIILKTQYHFVVNIPIQIPFYSFASITTSYHEL